MQKSHLLFYSFMTFIHGLLYCSNRVTRGTILLMSWNALQAHPYLDRPTFRSNDSPLIFLSCAVGVLDPYLCNVATVYSYLRALSHIYLSHAFRAIRHSRGNLALARWIDLLCICDSFSLFFNAIIGLFLPHCHVVLSGYSVNKLHSA